VTDYQPEEGLGYLVNRAARLMAQALARRLSPYGVAVGQLPVLLFLYRADDRTQAELSRLVAIEPATMVRNIDRMVRDGLVERRPHPKDARAVRIALTEKARALRDPLFAASQAANAEAMSAFGEAERERLLSELRVLVDHLSGEDGD
jgi:DNA-binding MarR family transcriptional regulator